MLQAQDGWGVAVKSEVMHSEVAQTSEYPSLKWTIALWFLVGLIPTLTFLSQQLAEVDSLGFWSLLGEWVLRFTPLAAAIFYKFGLFGALLGGAIDAQRRGGSAFRSLILGALAAALAYLTLSYINLVFPLSPGLEFWLNSNLFGLGQDELNTLVKEPPQRYLFVLLAAFAGLEVAALREPHPVPATPLFPLVLLILYTSCSIVPYASVGWESPALFGTVLLHCLTFSGFRARKWMGHKKANLGSL